MHRCIYLALACVAMGQAVPDVVLQRMFFMNVLARKTFAQRVADSVKDPNYAAAHGIRETPAAAYARVRDEYRSEIGLTVEEYALLEESAQASLQEHLDYQKQREQRMNAMRSLDPRTATDAQKRDARAQLATAVKADSDVDGKYWDRLRSNLSASGFANLEAHVHNKFAPAVHSEQMHPAERKQ